MNRNRPLLEASVIALLAGILTGWLLLGWALFPLNVKADPVHLNKAAKADLVLLAAESWSLTHDLPEAQARLKGIDAQELGDVLNRLVLDRRQHGDALEAARLSAFAQTYGIGLVANMGTAPPPAPSARLVVQAAGPTAVPLRISIAADITGSIRLAVEHWAKRNNAFIAPVNSSGDLVIGGDGGGGAALLAERVYVVADRFATLRTGISQSDLHHLWLGQATPDGIKTLLASEETVSALSRLFGSPASSVKELPPDSIATSLWNQASALAIVPFDELTVQLRALSIDDQSVLNRRLALDQYPLVSRIYVTGNSQLVQTLVGALRPKVPLTNRDPERITTVIMTGTTAITRTAAWQIEQKQDPAYPARIIGPVLAAADITHVSNEIPFIEGCQPVLHTMSFCSKPSYLATFKLAGVKIIGLTGNHELDFGPQPFLKTLDMYDAAGFKYYGGGRNAAEARKTLLVQDHGNSLAFIGTNSFGPTGDWATADGPGARRYDRAALQQEIAEAKQEADVVFEEHQAEETYDYQPSANNRLEFRASLDMGADVVTGVQAHQPQAVEFSADGRRVILYGLGNLFFDQMFQESVRQEMIARHTVYQGHLVQTELLTAMLEDYVQPRWATPAEREKILTAVFAASGWLPQ